MAAVVACVVLIVAAHEQQPKSPAVVGVDSDYPVAVCSHSLVVAVVALAVVV